MQAAERILQLLRSGSVSAWHLSIFSYGTSIHSIPEASFWNWIEFLLNDTEDSSAYVALDLCAHYISNTNLQRIMPKDLTERVLINRALAELPNKFQNNQNTYPFSWKLVAQRFIQENTPRSLILSQFILEYFDKPNSIFSYSQQGPRDILYQVTKQFPEDVWGQIIPRLGGAYAWSLTNWLKGEGFLWATSRKPRDSALSLIPMTIVWEWVDENVEERAWRAATFVPPILRQDKDGRCWARELLVRYGYREDVRRNLTANFSTEGWRGDESVHLENKKKRILEFRQTETDASVIRWINEYLEGIQRRIESARVEEEREF